jgi:hypothetical protein
MNKWLSIFLSTVVISGATVWTVAEMQPYHAPPKPEPPFSCKDHDGVKEIKGPMRHDDEEEMEYMVIVCNDGSINWQQ